MKRLFKSIIFMVLLFPIAINISLNAMDTAVEKQEEEILAIAGPIKQRDKVLEIVERIRRNCGRYYEEEEVSDKQKTSFLIQCDSKNLVYFLDRNSSTFETETNFENPTCINLFPLKIKSLALIDLQSYGDFALKNSLKELKTCLEKRLMSDHYKQYFDAFEKHKKNLELKRQEEEKKKEELRRETLRAKYDDPSRKKWWDCDELTEKQSSSANSMIDLSVGTTFQSVQSSSTSKPTVGDQKKVLSSSQVVPQIEIIEVGDVLQQNTNMNLAPKDRDQNCGHHALWNLKNLQQSGNVSCDKDKFDVFMETFAADDKAMITEDAIYNKIKEEKLKNTFVLGCRDVFDVGVSNDTFRSAVEMHGIMNQDYQENSLQMIARNFTEEEAVYCILCPVTTRQLSDWGHWILLKIQKNGAKITIQIYDSALAYQSMRNSGDKNINVVKNGFVQFFKWFIEEYIK